MRLATTWLRRKRAAHSFGSDNRGSAAAEFALLLPLMLTLYIGGVTVTDAVGVDRKIKIVAHTIADLTAQATKMSTSDISNVLDAATAVIVPYSSTPMSVTVTSIAIDANSKATVVWSETRNGTKRSGDVTSQIPSTFKVAQSCLVWGEANYTYTPAIGYVITGTINMSDQTFMRPRQAAWSSSSSSSCIVKS